MSAVDEDFARFTIYLMRTERRGVGHSTIPAHLKRCKRAVAKAIEKDSADLGCDTCSYHWLHADVSCPHGFIGQFTYGQFGQIDTLLAEFEAWLESQKRRPPK